MPSNIPLPVAMEVARAKLIKAFNQWVEETRLPAYLYEGMIVELLADIRNRKNIEVVAAVNEMTSEDKTTKEQDQEV